MQVELPAGGFSIDSFDSLLDANITMDEEKELKQELKKEDEQFISKIADNFVLLKLPVYLKENCAVTDTQPLTVYI